MRAVLGLPPITCMAKPQVVKRWKAQASRQATMPNARPPGTAVPGMVPIMLASPIGQADGLLRIDGSVRGPPTNWFIGAMAVCVGSELESATVTAGAARIPPDS